MWSNKGYNPLEYSVFFWLHPHTIQRCYSRAKIPLDKYSICVIFFLLNLFLSFLSSFLFCSISYILFLSPVIITHGDGLLLDSLLYCTNVLSYLKQKLCNSLSQIHEVVITTIRVLFCSWENYGCGKWEISFWCQGLEFL